MTEPQTSELIARLQAIVEGGEPDKAGRGYVLNLLAGSCVEIRRLRAALDDALNILQIALPAPRPWLTESTEAKLRIYHNMAVDRATPEPRKWDRLMSAGEPAGRTGSEDMTEPRTSDLEVYDPPTDRPYRLMFNPDAVANKWTIHVGGQEPMFFDDEGDAKHVFRMLAAVFNLGRHRAFHELRSLIGAK